MYSHIHNNYFGIIGRYNWDIFLCEVRVDTEDNLKALNVTFEGIISCLSPNYNLVSFTIYRLWSIANLITLCITWDMEGHFLIWYCMDLLSFCIMNVMQQDTQYLMINFIHNIQ